MILGAKQSTIKKLMLMNGVLGGQSVEDSVVGNPARFFTDLAKPLRSMLVPFLPVQSGTGDPSPENVRPISGWTGLNISRTGKNICPITVHPLNPLAYWGSSNIAYVEWLNTLKPGTYSIGVTYEVVEMPENGKVEHGRPYIIANVNGENVPLTSYYIAVDTSPSVGKTYRDTGTFTITEETAGKITNCYFYCDQQTTHTGTGRGLYNIKEVQLELGSTASPYAEYTGQSYPVTFPAVGKNLLPNKKYQYSATQVRLGGENSTEVYKKLKAGTYTLSVTGNVNVQCYYTHNSVNKLLGSNGGTLTVTEADEDKSYCFYCYKSGSLSADDVLTWQLETGDTATAYEPFTNTVYGGTLDAVSGVLTVDKQIYNLSDISWNKDTNRPGIFYGGITGREISSDVIACSTYLVTNTNISTSPDKSISGYPNYGGQYIFLRDTAFAEMTATEMKDAVTGQLVYKLATPIEIPLDPIAVQTLLGDNTIWTDTNGENAITFLKKG